MFRLLLYLLLFSFTLSPLEAVKVSDRKRRTLYASLRAHSVKEHLAFYQLFPDTLEGKKALQHIWALFNKNGMSTPLPYLSSDKLLPPLIQLIGKQPSEEVPQLSATDLNVIHTLAESLGNRRLKGYNAQSEEVVLQLPSEQIDLARAVLLSQQKILGHNALCLESYEAYIDLVALQIYAELPLEASDLEKVAAINRYLFQELHFHFPPLSQHIKNIDTYTFLSSVLNQQEGVCLGTSVLYLSIAQRLDLPLEVVTPPGHIYVRYRKGEVLHNIETTMRGVHIDDEQYLGINDLKLPVRSLKEVVGMVHMNQAGMYLGEGEFKKASECYQRADCYLSEDPLYQELAGFSFLFSGEHHRGQELLQKSLEGTHCDVIHQSCLAKDYLEGRINLEGIQTLFRHLDPQRTSLIERKNVLLGLLKRYPKFREGWQYLGSLWLQLYRTKEALEAFEMYHALDPSHPAIEYNLATLHAMREDLPSAWKHLREAENLLKGSEIKRKEIKQLRRELTLLSPNE